MARSELAVNLATAWPQYDRVATALCLAAAFCEGQVPQPTCCRDSNGDRLVLMDVLLQDKTLFRFVVTGP